MNFFKTILSATLALFTTTACSQNKTEKQMENEKTLVVYFSATGTTKQAAEKLAKATNADLCEIVPEKAYSLADLNWNNHQSRSTIEMKDEKSRPSIKTDKIDVSQYNHIFLGYPIWWDLAPRVVNSFIENHHLKGKTIITFATSGGSSITNSTQQLKKSYPEINWQEGMLLNGMSENEIGRWIENLSE